MLEPMSAGDRKVVHDAIGEIPGVRSYSEGEPPDRYVVISRVEDEAATVEATPPAETMAEEIPEEDEAATVEATPPAETMAEEIPEEDEAATVEATPPAETMAEEIPKEDEAEPSEQTADAGGEADAPEPDEVRD